MVTICNVDDYIVSGAQLALKRARKAEHGRETQTNISTVSSYKNSASSQGEKEDQGQACHAKTGDKCYAASIYNLLASVIPPQEEERSKQCHLLKI